MSDVTFSVLFFVARKKVQFIYNHKYDIYKKNINNKISGTENISCLVATVSQSKAISNVR